MRLRTHWDWRLRVYPFIVIPLLIYVVHSNESGYHRNLRDTVISPATEWAAPLHGIHNGTAISCFTHPKVTLCYQLTKERR